MNYTLIGLSVSTLACIVAIKLLRQPSQRFGLIDYPNSRKQHKMATPVIGGLSMFIGFVVGQLYISFYLDQLTLLFLLSSFIVVCLGAYDDYVDLPVFFRLFVQLFATLILVIFGDGVIINLGNLVGFGDIMLGSWSILVSVLAFIGVMNSLNMIDGIDGLAGIFSLLVFSSIAFLSLNKSHSHLLFSLLFCSVTIPFITSNLNLFGKKNKKIFMGDAGSMFLGLGIAWLLISSTQGENPAFRPITALWFFAIPLIDALSVIIRRIMNGQSPFNPDRSHLHHILIRLGCSERQTLVLIIRSSFIMILAGILSEKIQAPEWIMLSLLLMIFLFYLIATIQIEKK